MARTKLKRIDGLAQKKLEVLIATLRKDELMLAAQKAKTLLVLLRNKDTLFRLIPGDLHDKLQEALATASNPVSK